MGKKETNIGLSSSFIRLYMRDYEFNCTSVSVIYIFEALFCNFAYSSAYNRIQATFFKFQAIRIA